MKKKNTHLEYFLAIIMLMFFTVILTSTLVFSIARLSITVNLALIIVYALFAGYISAKVIEKNIHKEKKEILAGSLIPLPATISIIIYVLVINNLKFIETIDPVVASAGFFIAFNTPFLVFFYEHEKHKHNLIGFTIAPLALAVIYLFAFFMTSFIATDLIKPQIMDSFTLSYEIAPVKNYVENCLASLGNDAVEKGEDIKEYIDSNMDECIGSFAVFENKEIKTERFTSSVEYGESTVTIKLHYPVSFTKSRFNYKITDFQTTITR